MNKEFERTTPHAPCTPTWMQNAPAAREEKEVGKIHRGMKAFFFWKYIEFFVVNP